MTRKTNEELKQEYKTLEKNYEEAVQVQRNIKDRCIAINAILEDRAEAEKESQFETCTPKLEKTLESTTFNSNIQKFYVKSTDYMGDETGNATNSLVFEGLNYSSKNRLKVNAVNKIRAGVKISRNVTESGFGFLSVGENYNDDKSLFFGDFQIKDRDQKGSIVWRKHINPYKDSSECLQIRNQSGIKNVNNLPDTSRQNGGLWVQPLLLPSKPTYDKPKGSPGGDWQPGNGQSYLIRPVTKFETKPDLERAKWLPRLQLSDVVYYEKWEEKDVPDWKTIQQYIKANIDHA